MPPVRTANAGSMLSGMFDVWIKNFGAFFLVYLVLGLVTGGIGALLGYVFFRIVTVGGFTPLPGLSSIPLTDLALAAAYIIASIVISVILNTIVAGAMSEFSVRRFRGESMPVEAALRRGVQKFFSIFGASILYDLIIFGILLVPLFLIIPLALSGGNLGFLFVLLLGFLVAGIFALYVGVALNLYAPAIMMENGTAVGGLSRSWRIMKGHWWSLFGAIVVAVILGGLITLVISILTGATGNVVVSIIGTAVASAIVSPLLVILAGVAYDLIVRSYPPSMQPMPPYPAQPAYAPPPPPQPPTS